MIVKDAQGIYQIDGNPESLDLQMTDGVIVFSRKKTLSRPEKPFRNLP